MNVKEIVKKIQAIAFLLILPTFLLGGTIFAENIVEWNVGNLILGLVLVMVAAVCFTFVLITDR